VELVIKFYQDGLLKCMWRIAGEISNARNDYEWVQKCSYSKVSVDFCVCNQLSWSRNLPLLWYPKFYHCVHKSARLFPIVSHLNLVHNVEIRLRGSILGRGNDGIFSSPLLPDRFRGPPNL